MSREQSVLRAKYLDWCSARLAERFVELTPEEIYQLAERASRKQGLGAAPPSSTSPEVESKTRAGALAGGDGDAKSFRELVQRVTDALAVELALPGFAEWAAWYRADPARYDDELLGLWRER